MALSRQPPTLRRRRRRRKHTPLHLFTTLFTLLLHVLLFRCASAAETHESFLYNTPLDSLLPGGGFSLALDGPRALLDRRQTSITVPLKNGVAGKTPNLLWGGEQLHHIPSSEIFDSKDEARPKTVFLTLNTCLQPRGITDKSPDPPALEIYVSNTTANRSPGPGVKGKYQLSVEVDQGFGRVDMDASGDIWVGVYAPEMEDEMEGNFVKDSPWSYELVLSTEKPYHGYIEDQFLYLVDTDGSTGLLITGNMTSTSSRHGGVNETLSSEELMAITSKQGYPYQMFAQNNAIKSRFSGLEKSYCAVRQLAQKKAGDTDVSMTTRGMGGLPKQQFLLKELNLSSTYLGYLTRPRDPKSGTLEANQEDTSGILWQPMQLTTKSDGNCAIIYDLPFCSEAAYAVPSNPTMSQFGATGENLISFYDNLASNWWSNFTYSLQQVQCNASSDAAYSLVRTCDDCAAAYKNWLCAVTIPRCMDNTSRLPYLAERSSSKLFWNATAQGWAKHTYDNIMTAEEVQEYMNTKGRDTPLEKAISRNQLIDEHVMPGPYKEIKPCKDLCWKLMQDCPSSLGFKCPQEGTRGLEMSYGERDEDGDVTCSYLGAVYFLSAARERFGGVSVGVVVWVVGVVVVGLML